MAKKTKASLRKPLLIIVLVFGPALLLILISMNKCEHKFTKLPSYGTIGQYSFVDANGNEITNTNQEGNVVLFHTIQPSCPKNCAINVAKFNLLLYQHYRQQQKKMNHIKFIGIATDEKGNPLPKEQLEEMEFIMNDIIEGYNSDIWKIVTGDPKQIYDIESNNVNLYTQESDSAFAGKTFLETLLIVDKSNELRLVRRGNKEGYIRDFKEHVALLQKQYDKQAFKEKKEDEK